MNTHTFLSLDVVARYDYHLGESGDPEAFIYMTTYDGSRIILSEEERLDLQKEIIDDCRSGHLKFQTSGTAKVPLTLRLDVEYTFTPGDEPRTLGRPEDCDEGHPDELEIEAVYHNGYRIELTDEDTNELYKAL